MVCVTDFRVGVLFVIFVLTSIAYAAPTFDGGAVAAANVAENTATGELVTDTITAMSDGAGTITYALTTQTPDSTPPKFAVDTTNGRVTVINPLDYESGVISYSLLITASDDGDMATADHTLTVAITDVAEDPNFAETSKNVTVADGTATGETVTTMAATDPQGDTLTYAIAPTTAFAISGTGVITTTVVMDRSTTPGYELSITASDPNSNVATATVFVCVGNSTNCFVSGGNGDNGGGGAATIYGSLIPTFFSLIALVLY